MLFEETDWLCFALLCFFHQEITGDGCALRGDGLTFLPWENRILLHFFIKKLQVMDVLFEETDWLCSPWRIAYYYIFSSRNCR